MRSSIETQLDICRALRGHVIADLTREAGDERAQVRVAATSFIIEDYIETLRELRSAARDADPFVLALDEQARKALLDLFTRLGGAETLPGERDTLELYFFLRALRTWLNGTHAKLEVGPENGR